jgi:hypothetical protein
MNIVNVMLWMKRNAYEDSTVKKVAKLLRHLKRNCKETKKVMKKYPVHITCSNLLFKQ